MIKRIVSLTLAWMFAVSALSGIALYVAPPGRVAHWADWMLAGLGKTEWENLHTVTTILMIIAAGLHLYYNWKPFVSYMKDKVTRSFSATRELVISLAVIITVGAGSINPVPPFSWIIDLGNYVSEEWEVTYGTPPYNHAELDTLEQFCTRLGMDYEVTSVLLGDKGIVHARGKTLLEIAAENTISPQDIYKLIDTRKNIRPKMPIQGSGMGKKMLQQVCEIRGLDIDTVQKRLQAKGIEADASERFKSIAEKNGMHPMDILRIIEEGE